jgi:hypothetical protein
MSIELLAESRRDPVVLESLREGNQAVLELLTQIARTASERGETNPDVQPEAFGRVLMGLYLGLLWQKTIEPSLDTVSYASAVTSLLHGNFWRGSTTGQPATPSALQH